MQSSGCSIEQISLASATSALMYARLRGILSAEKHSLNLSNVAVTSGASHDSAYLSRFAPAAMIFIPCVDGLSYRAQELYNIRGNRQRRGSDYTKHPPSCQKANFDFLNKSFA